MDDLESLRKERELGKLLDMNVDSANQLLEDIRDTIHAYEGPITLVTLIGILETLKFEVLEALKHDS